MKKGRFPEEQMVGILREADRNPVAQVAKKRAIWGRILNLEFFGKIGRQ